MAPRSTIDADAVLLALGGASWPKLGSDGRWADIFDDAGIAVVPLAPANCGVHVAWSDVFRSRFEGAALKRIALTIGGVTQRGEAIVTGNGLEGGAVYALGPHIRQRLRDRKNREARRRPQAGFSLPDLARRLEKPRGSDTMTNHLRKAAHLDPVAIGLLRETALPDVPRRWPRASKPCPFASPVLKVSSGRFRRLAASAGAAWTTV